MRSANVGAVVALITPAKADEYVATHPTTPTDLHGIMEWFEGEAENLWARQRRFGATEAKVNAARIRVIAKEMEFKVSVQGTHDAVILDFIKYARALPEVLATVLVSRKTLNAVADAIILDGMDAAESTARAGYEAAQLQDLLRLERVYSSELHAMVGELKAKVAELEQNRDHGDGVTVVFEVAQPGTAGGISPEQASDLALLLTDPNADGA